MKASGTKKTAAVMETAFDILYLATIFTSAAVYFFSAGGRDLFKLFAVMALVLGVGDSFHLVPRILDANDKSGRDYTAPLGIGKLAASLTMTVFYVILWRIGAGLYPGTSLLNLTGVFYALAVVRILLCLFPQNGWTKKDPPLKWPILRNAPFFLMGILSCALFFEGGMLSGGELRFVWLFIFLSFACYLPVVLSEKKGPHLAVLMILKSCAYVAVALSGFFIA